MSKNNDTLQRGHLLKKTAQHWSLAWCGEGHLLCADFAGAVTERSTLPLSGRDAAISLKLTCQCDYFFLGKHQRCLRSGPRHVRVADPLDRRTNSLYLYSAYFLRFVFF
jgi:hypothetical protein